jgi:hypothetical protein
VIIDDGGFVDCIDEVLHRFKVFQRAPIKVRNRISVRIWAGVCKVDPSLVESQQ